MPNGSPHLHHPGDRSHLSTAGRAGGGTRLQFHPNLRVSSSQASDLKREIRVLSMTRLVPGKLAPGVAGPRHAVPGSLLHGEPCPLRHSHFQTARPPRTADRSNEPHDDGPIRNVSNTPPPGEKTETQKNTRQDWRAPTDVNTYIDQRNAEGREAPCVSLSPVA